MNIVQTFVILVKTYLKPAAEELEKAVINIASYTRDHSCPLLLRGLVVVGLLLFLILMYPIAKFIGMMIAIKIAIAHGML